MSRHGWLSRVLVPGLCSIALAGALTSCSADSKAAAGSKSAVGSKAKTEAMPAKPAAGGTEGTQFASAVFAGGCFWCMETAYEGKPGVVSVVSGFSGGREEHPTYEQVSAGGTGHAESVEVTYDPKLITYGQLLDIFWHNIDPTQANGQFCDRGTQYRSVIFYGNAEEQKLAEASEAEVAKQLQKKIVTEIVAAGPFYPAEDYHQDFWKKDPVRYYSYRTGCGRDARLKQIWGKAPDVAH